MKFETNLLKISVNKTYKVLLEGKDIATIEEYEVNNTKKMVEHRFNVTEVLIDNMMCRVFTYYESLDECFKYIDTVINSTADSFENVKHILKKEIPNIISIDKSPDKNKKADVIIHIPNQHFNSKIYQTIKDILDESDQILEYNGISFHTPNTNTQIKIEGVIFIVR